MKNYSTIKLIESLDFMPHILAIKNKRVKAGMICTHFDSFLELSGKQQMKCIEFVMKIKFNKTQISDIYDATDYNCVKRGIDLLKNGNYREIRMVLRDVNDYILDVFKK